MNVYDSARMADVLAPLGFAPACAPEEADLVILNTCHIREKAVEKVYSEIGRLRRFKRAKENRGGMLIAVAGCVAQAEGEEIIRRAPDVDLVFGPQTYHRLPQMLARAARRKADREGEAQSVIDTEFPIDSKFDLLPESSLPSGVSAYLTVQEGCDRFCSFCVVPYTRGQEYSRPRQAVLDEAKGLVVRGAREITLLGQNVNAYHGAVPGSGAEWGLGRLIRELAEIDGLERIRYTTSHPCDMDADLIAAHGEVAKLMPFLHLPIQSGSDKVLAAMKRRHNSDDYRRTVDSLRAVRPDLALSSDFIVGFPDETDSDFAATLELIREIGFAQAYSFKYSPRPGTPAAAVEPQLNDRVKGERLAVLQDVLNAQQALFNQASAGLTVPVLFDRRGKGPGHRKDQLLGRSPHMQAVHVQAAGAGSLEGWIGVIVDVQILAAHPNSLTGRIAEPPCTIPRAPPTVETLGA